MFDIGTLSAQVSAVVGALARYDAAKVYAPSDSLTAGTTRQQASVAIDRLIATLRHLKAQVEGTENGEALVRRTGLPGGDSGDVTDVQGRLDTGADGSPQGGE